MVRILLDTNVLINADRGAGSYGQRILDLVLQGKLIAVTSHPVRRENELMVNKLVTDKVLRRQVREFLAKCEFITASPVEVNLADTEDIKLIAAAVGGGAQFLITDDHHLLDLDEYNGIKIVTPKNFWQWWEGQQDELGETWNSWAKQLLHK